MPWFGSKFFGTPFFGAASLVPVVPSGGSVSTGPAVTQKQAMSWLRELLGGAIVPPPKFGTGKRVSNFPHEQWLGVIGARQKLIELKQQQVEIKQCLEKLEWWKKIEEDDEELFLLF